MAYFLGIDGGGSKTKLVLGDEHSVLAEATVAGSNIVRLGAEHVRNSLSQGLAQICQAAGVRREQLVAVCAGLSGGARDSVREKAEAMLTSLLPGAAIEVIGDMVIAHEAALGGDPGVIVIAGTGSIAYGRNAAGQTARAGGWGFAVSDEGSGHWIGVRAVSTVLQALDAGEPTLLEPGIMALWRIASHDELVRKANASPKPDFAAIFPVVCDAFDGGDSRARDILVSAGTELASIAHAVALRLWARDEAVKVLMMGGVFTRASAVRQAFDVVLRDNMPNIEIKLSNADPALGALARTRRLRSTSAVKRQF